MMRAFDAEPMTKILNLINTKNIYRKVMTDPLYKNSLFQMASTLVLAGVGLVFWMLITRMYKAENVGIATTLLSTMTLLSSFSILGLCDSLHRYLPTSVHKKDFINSAFTIVTLVTTLACVLFLLGLQLFSPQLVFLRSSAYYFISFTMFAIFNSWNSLAESIFMAFRCASDILIKNTIASILKLFIPFALIAFGFYGIYASSASALALGVLVSLITLKIKFEFKPSFSINAGLIKKSLAYSFSNYVTGFLLSAPSLILPLIILNILSAKYSAYFYVASMIQNALQIIPLATCQSLLTEGAYNEVELRKHVKKALATIFVILIPAIILIVFAGKILLQFFGKSYAAGAFQFLQLYSVSTLFTSLLLVANTINNVKYRKKTLVISNIVASVLTLCLAYAFNSGGLVGVGWGWMFGQAAAGVIAAFYIIKLFQPGAYNTPRKLSSRIS